MEIMKHKNEVSSLKEDKKHSINSSVMYSRFVLMALMMFCFMYIIMYTMIDNPRNFISNINNLYMTLMMVSAMLLIELWVMRKRYRNRKLNCIIVSIGVMTSLFSWFGIREQVNVDDRQFVKSMIPHHAAALLISEKVHLSDPQLIILQRNIFKTQSAEIKLMKRKLKELERR
ncbi:DUF305 domain-containing protein [Chryseobacterium cucumeris]|jgi:hypothetical protein|uniref:DUF305 domain-containing protein n=2 Tax=Chryseobacterium group TaxID=2782232 RepID=A0ABX9X171_9FLAO|nr:DUF305 domain-containing protein [Chryseobacterium cucumeris]QWT86202.1 DUF305 domain-containing protein [Chryseobacterium sp. PCH239]ROH88889.1 DUF305 domain-containing protein [Chryseobacterium cucumeris]